MNKNAIQKFAIWARTEMIAQVSQRAYQYGITAEGYGEEDAIAVNGRALSPDEAHQRTALIAQIKEKGYDQVMEEVAYTWFNRFIALRFMEVNNYLPSHIRVFSDANGAFKPEILADALHLELDGLDKAKVAAYIERNQTDDLYRYLLLTQCNALNTALPGMFQRLGSYTELLLPNNILKNDSILGRLVTDIPEEDWQDQVQIIGWLYQYYNSELKEETYALLKKNVKVTKERIPSATQLFTPDWIVRYMVENSLGRLAINAHLMGVTSLGSAGSEEERIVQEKLLAEKMGWKYYLPEAEQTPEVHAQLNALTTSGHILDSLKLIDPCMGSGHILVYAFDVLIQIYEANGVSQRDAAQRILTHNLYGLDIDDRAAQLAYFAVMMKARQYDRRIFTRGIQPHLYALQNSQPVHDEAWSYLGTEETIARRLHASFENAKELGSLTPVALTEDEGSRLRDRLAQIEEQATAGDLTARAYASQLLATLLPLLTIAELLLQKYDIVVTNPPYMGSSNMSKTLSDFVKKHYPDSKSDLFACFMERCHELTAANGYQAMITQHAWMFLSSYEKLRAKLLQLDTINMTHFGPRAFDEIVGEVVQTTSFVMQNCCVPGRKGNYVRLIDYAGEAEKEQAFLSTDNRPLYTALQSNFSKIPGSPIAYWVSDKMMTIFELPTVSDIGKVVTGMTTADNERFLRLWYEVNAKKISLFNGEKWFPYQKGGDYRKWFGNNELVVNWENNGFEIKHNIDPTTKKIRSGSYNEEYILNAGLTWTYITSSDVSMRYVPKGFIFDNKGSMIFFKDENTMLKSLAFLSSKIAGIITKILNPTISFQPGNMATMPVAISTGSDDLIKILVNECIYISKKDWNFYETSWDFKQHPLV